MHINVFDKLSLGGKSKKNSPAEKEAQAAKLADMELEVSNSTKNLQKATDKLNQLKTEAGIAIPLDVPPVRPHGPAAELTLETEDLQDSDVITLDEVTEDPVKPAEEVKIAEVTVARAAAAPKSVPASPEPKAAPAVAAVTPAAEKKEEKKEEKPDDNDSLNKLFSSDEQEENPLASLIASLPDVTVQELMDDLAEIHRIIKEWKPSAK